MANQRPKEQTIVNVSNGHKVIIKSKEPTSVTAQSYRESCDFYDALWH